MIIKLIKRIIRLLRCITRINWFDFLKYYDSKSNNIIWIHNPKLSYLGSDAFVKDCGLVFGLLKEQKDFRIFSGDKIGKLHHKTIFYTLSDTYNRFGFANYVAVFEHVCSMLEQQNNKLIPSLHDVRFWENKAFMHQRFKELNVSEPQTILHPLDQPLNPSSYAYPLLVKAEHSCSSNGLFKMNTPEELVQLAGSKEYQSENKTLIIQELIDMRKDLRVILVGDEIVLHYWRINKSKEWKPTSTSYGSDVDFVFFPEQWRSHIMNTFKALKLSSGAFDITWDQDDLTKEPKYLEVSPVFQPNPVIKTNSKPYAHYKKNITLFPSWDIAYVDIVFEIKHKEVIANLDRCQ